MEVQKDFKELLELLNEQKVEFILVGAYALAFHGAPRYTGDLDIYIKPDIDNSKNVMKALVKFGFGSVGIKDEDLQKPDRVIQLGFPPVRIDLVTSISGVSWEEANSDKVSGIFGDVQVYYIGRESFIANKKATGRKKDLADIEALGEK
ncbi:MAG TPA: hypothetical protein PLK90_08160 [Clostridiales bacterium]|jgi:predicted nucleotidyltransferase|nr:hypothetical protein [Clostridiales bacterium]HQP70357.1 hypothetical protein [Clostridiales bacterium]